MPGLAGLDVPGVIHHIIIRGIKRPKIFRDSQDRDDIIDRRYKLESHGQDLDRIEQRILGSSHKSVQKSPVR